MYASICVLSKWRVALPLIDCAVWIDFCEWRMRRHAFSWFPSAIGVLSRAYSAQQPYISHIIAFRIAIAIRDYTDKRKRCEARKIDWPDKNGRFSALCMQRLHTTLVSHNTLEWFEVFYFSYTSHFAKYMQSYTSNTTTSSSSSLTTTKQKVFKLWIEKLKRSSNKQQKHKHITQHIKRVTEKTFIKTSPSTQGYWSDL